MIIVRGRKIYETVGRGRTGYADIFKSLALVRGLVDNEDARGVKRSGGASNGGHIYPAAAHAPPSRPDIPR